MGKNKLTATLSQCVDGGRSIRTSHCETGFEFSVRPAGFVSGWMSSHVQDNQAAKNVGRIRAPGREEAVNGPYAPTTHFSPLTGEIGGRTGQR